ncbi:hypothetical protein DKT68_02660 [Micromonospora acroterricola]|uniref:Uncharacterized protein n=1 Tax=Micromonospora acroterricola TaxID=2202421 RepID=A0A317DIM8_9ACTN|nr:hypothetical protein DKT68_02660 [Micromonospora acroterricola]
MPARRDAAGVSAVCPVPVRRAVVDASAARSVPSWGEVLDRLVVDASAARSVPFRGDVLDRLVVDVSAARPAPARRELVDRLLGDAGAAARAGFVVGVDRLAAVDLPVESASRPLVSAAPVRWRPVLSRPAAGVPGRPLRPRRDSLPGSAAVPPGRAGSPGSAGVPPGRDGTAGSVSGGGFGEVSTDVKRAGRPRVTNGSGRRCEQGRSRRPVCASSATTLVRTPDAPGAATAVPGAAGRDDGLGHRPGRPPRAAYSESLASVTCATQWEY